MKDDHQFTAWDNIVSEFEKKSVSKAIGLFTTSGQLLDANEIMCIFLDTDKQKLAPVNSFVNPTFSQLAQLENKNETIFEGLLTIGNYSDQSFVLMARIVKKNDKLLVLAEADVKQMFVENKQLSQLNQEVNNLQRQLIKEKKKLQLTLNELKETQQMLIHSEKMNAMGQLVAGVAHELNNPISFVNSNLFSLEKYVAEFLESVQEIENVVIQNASKEVVDLVETIKKESDFDYLNKDIQDILSESKNGIDRVKTIVEDLRKFSRLDEAEMKHIELIENINSTISIIRSEIINKNIAFEFVSSERIEIDCFPGQLNQAILNILLNAVYAVEKGGKIRLTVSEKANEIMISVLDNGSGIPADVIGKIFDPFFTTKPVGMGTGLGLSITYKIINNLHKGKIEVNSEPEKGTEFIIKIPKKI